MVKENRLGLTARNMRDRIRKGRRTGEAPTSGVMARNTKALGKMIRLWVKGLTRGRTGGRIAETGKIIKCMEKVYTNGQKVVFMKETLSMTKSTAMVNILNLMESNI